MKTFLKLLFIAIFGTMIWVTTWAQSQEALWAAMDRIPRDPWFVATLFDTYFAFLCFFLWVAFRERSVIAKAFWFVAIMLMGNIAMSLYVLIQLFRLKPEEPASAILKPAQ